MNDFGIGRIRDFEHMPLEQQQREAKRTERTVREILNRPRSEFPAVTVMYDGREVSEIALDRAWTLTRLVLRQRGGDVLQELAKQMPAALADEAARRQRVEHAPTLTNDGERKVAEARLEGLPREPLRAPLFLQPAAD